MCKITEFNKQRLEDAVELLSSKSVRGYNLLTEDENIYFSTSSGKRYKVDSKIIIVSSNCKNGSCDRMIPHKEMKRIFEELNILDVVEKLQNSFENVAFIAKNVA